MADSGNNKNAWRRSSQQPPAQRNRDDSASRTKENNVPGNKVSKPAVPQQQKATSPAPPPQNPWNKGASTITKGGSGASTPVPKEKPASSTATAAPDSKAKTGAPGMDSLRQSQVIPGANADEVHKMFEEAAKENAKNLGPEGYVVLDENDISGKKKAAWGSEAQTQKRKPGTMANGQNFWEELARQLAEFETGGDAKKKGNSAAASDCVENGNIAATSHSPQHDTHFGTTNNLHEHFGDDECKETKWTTVAPKKRSAKQKSNFVAVGSGFTEATQSSARPPADKSYCTENATTCHADSDSTASMSPTPAPSTMAASIDGPQEADAPPTPKLTKNQRKNQRKKAKAKKEKEEKAAEQVEIEKAAEEAKQMRLAKKIEGLARVLDNIKSAESLKANVEASSPKLAREMLKACQLPQGRWRITREEVVSADPKMVCKFYGAVEASGFLTPEVIKMARQQLGDWLSNRNKEDYVPAPSVENAVGTYKTARANGNADTLDEFAAFVTREASKAAKANPSLC